MVGEVRLSDKARCSRGEIKDKKKKKKKQHSAKKSQENEDEVDATAFT